YTDLLSSGQLRAENLLFYFSTLDESFSTLPPDHRRQAIATLYGQEGRYADPFTWCDSGHALAFFHFPKTGGMSIRRMLSRAYHPLQIGSEVASSQSPSASRLIRFFASHFTWPEYLNLPGPLKTLSCLRNPRVRLRSLYQFLAGLGDSARPPYTAAALAAQAGEGAFFRSKDPEVVNAVNNVYVRTLADASANSNGDPLAANPERALDLAFERLLSFDAVLFLEETENGGELPARVSRFLSSVTNDE